MPATTTDQLLERLSAAVAASFGPDAAVSPAWVQSCADPKFGDYQFNGALPLAKTLGQKPRDIAAKIVAALRMEDLCEPPEIAGPGFINFRLKPEYLAQRLHSVTADASGRLGMAPLTTPQTVVVDFSSPNLARRSPAQHRDR
jgi:arginyl-tRNA synthetase